MLKIVADDKIPFLKGALEPYANVSYLPGSSITGELIRDADALLIRTRTKCTESLLEGSAIKFIGTATIGFDHIDTEYCNQKKIFWTNAPGCNSSSVQQYVAAALLSISSEMGFNLREKTLGIIGVGNVGSKVEKIARAMGMRVLLNDPPRARVEGSSGFCSLSMILAESDIITVHVPLNLTGEDYTFHLFEEESFSKMKTGAWFINSSRGEVTDTTELKSVLKSGILAGAVTDVWENEPDIDNELLELSTLATPHIAGYSTDGKANGTAMTVNSMCRFFNLPLNDWYPSAVPAPLTPIISVNCSGKSEEAVIREAVKHSYNILEDDHNLRRAPSDFEKLREGYGIRREFTSYTVKLDNETENIARLLGDMGFRISH
jgi:erythronate-4-phosphate dehydrogenase